MKQGALCLRAIVVTALLLGSAAGAQDSPDTAPHFVTHDSAIEKSLELRTRYNIHIPDSEVAVYIDSTSIHHLREEQSTVATRDADGHWHISAVVEEGPGLLNVEPHLVSNENRMLSETECRQLDELLNRGDLYREHWETRETPAIGTVHHTMEIHTSKGHMVIKWSGRLSGKVGAIADLIIGHD